MKVLTRPNYDITKYNDMAFVHDFAVSRYQAQDNQYNAHGLIILLVAFNAYFITLQILIALNLSSFAHTFHQTYMYMQS